MNFSLKKLALLSLSFIILFSNCASDNQAIDLASLSENSTQVGDAGAFFPNTSGSNDTCNTDDDGNCTENEVGTGSVFLSQQHFDFGLSETNNVECIAVAIPNGLPFAAELDKDHTDQVNGAYQFVFESGNGVYSDSRIEGSGRLNLCYLREAVGQHHGQVKLVINAEGNGAAYAYVLTTTGMTETPVFTITNPTDGQIIDKRNGYNEGIDDTEGDYLITARGSVNLDLVSIFKNGMETEIIINSAGVKSKATFDSAGHFSKVIGLPQVQGVYQVLFSLDTNRGTTLNKGVDVVVAGTPNLSIVVRDANGIAVGNDTPTDAPSLIVGFRVSNLNSSGSSEEEMPVTLSDMKFNGQPLADDQQIWYDPENTSWCQNPDRDANPTSGLRPDYKGFNGSFTFCVPLAETSNLQSGANTITARATNVLGQTDIIKFILILDNKKPVVNITSPRINELFPPETNTITISGTIKNYAPVDVALVDQVPTPTGSNIGAFCQPKEEDDPDCPKSGVLLYVNTSTDDENLPIYIYPDPGTYGADTIRQSNQQILLEDSNKGNCSISEITEVIFDGDKDNTTVDADGNIITTLTDEAGNQTVYITDPNGNIQYSDDLTNTQENTVTVIEKENVSNQVTHSSEQTQSIIDDSGLDLKVTTTTDASTGEITQTTEQIQCNVPEGEFRITLSYPSEDYHGKINLFTNVIQIQADSISGHNTAQVQVFQTGITNKSSEKINGSFRRSLTYALTSGSLGVPHENCAPDDNRCVTRAPLMLNLSEGTINHNSESQTAKDLIKVVEKLLNEDLDFAEVANGWLYWPEDANGKINLEENFQKEYKDKHGSRYDDFENIDRVDQENFIRQALHSNNMATKYWALIRYQNILIEDQVGNCAERPDQCFFKSSGDPFENYDVAKDACGSTITTAFVPMGDHRHIYKDIDSSIDPRFLDVWPTALAPNKNFNNFVSGKWIVHKLNLKPEGGIGADICLVPDDKDNAELARRYREEGCDADVSIADTPAFWGHFVSYNLIQGGLLGPQASGLNGQDVQINDETFPLIWSIGKLRLKLTDAIKIKTTETNGTWTNMLEINPNGISIIEDDETDNLFNSNIMNDKSIQIEPFAKCDQYYRELYPLEDYPNTKLPFGCNYTETENHPFILERNTIAGERLYNSPLFGEGENTFMLGAVWQGVIQTFKKLVGCLDEEMVNPLLNEAIFAYPPWINQEDKLSTDFEWEDYTFNLDLKHSDLNIFNGGLTARIPMSVTADGVSKPLGSSSDSFSGTLDDPTFSVQAYERAFDKGHLIRSEEQGNLDQYPLSLPRGANQDLAFLGLSLNVEEVVNALGYMLFQKGPLSLLETFDVDEIEQNTAWSMGIDKVVLGRFDICDIAGILSANLPADLLFSSVISLFDFPDTHLDIILDPNSPITFSMNPLNGTNQSTEIQLGISNLQIAVKELRPYQGAADVFHNPKDQSEVLRLRVDGVLGMKAVFHKNLNKLNIFFDNYDKQNLHVTVVPGASGGTYNDRVVVSDIISSVIGNLFSNINKEFDDSEDASATLEITLKGDDSGKFSVANLLDEIDIEFNSNLADNTACGDDVPVYVEEYKFSNLGTRTHLTGPRDESVDYSNIIDRLLNGAPNNPDTSDPNDSNNDSDDNSNNDQDSGNSSNNSGIGSRGEIEADSAEEIEDGILVDPCVHLTATGIIMEDQENIIKETLCHVGIEDIFLEPNIIFDNTNGYIHISSEILLELTKELGGGE